MEKQAVGCQPCPSDSQRGEPVTTGQCLYINIHCGIGSGAQNFSYFVLSAQEEAEDGGEGKDLER